jgi:hypothetical protein
MERYYEKFKRVPFCRTRNRPSNLGRHYDIWATDAGDYSQKRLDDGDDSTNLSVHCPHEASTDSGARPSPTVLGADAQAFGQKDEARSKGEVTFKGELLSPVSSRLFNTYRD